MSSAAGEAYVNTRVSIMATRLLAPGQLESLARLDLAELAEQLALGDLLDGQRDGRLDRRAQGDTRAKSRAVEQALIATLLAELRVLVRPMRPLERDLVRAWGRRYALFNLKALLRGKLYDLDPSDIEDHLYGLPPELGLGEPALLRAENVLELLRNLEGGPYALIARQAREVYEQRREPSALEAAIDQLYYERLARQVLQFHDEHLRPLQVLVGALLDRVGLLWLLRSRFVFGLSPSETFFRLVPSFRVMHRDRLIALVDLDSRERVLEALPEPFADLLAESRDLVDIQRRLGTHVLAETRRVLRLSRSGVARALAYLMLRELDLMTLFALIQGRLLGLPAGLIGQAVDLAEPEARGPARHLEDAT
ncbi:V0D/AC39 family V-type ATPase subunit [Thiococcus pfennigii]|jgi:V/A-type H+-transporting ATPase subunit C|uniref:V0D/AC39 family V-type ATPase subunit n=1 Tax=Thiococcus pfennigii TaxID=1057 RepID=UPI001906275A|nr:V-type ATPase subunit [Thiococcus pfennigii]MBK1700793.1 ATPase [Thiococcus pfennigii]